MKQFSSLITKALAGADLTEAFKTKGDLKRWSAKRTVGRHDAIADNERATTSLRTA